MKLLDFILSILRKTKKPIKILFPEGNNKIIQSVVLKIINFNSPVKNYIIPILLLNKINYIPKNIKNSNIKIIFIDKLKINLFANQLYELRKSKGLDLLTATKLIANNNYYSMMLLKNKIIDGIVAGIDYNTADILRPALQIIQTNPNYKIISSIFIMNKKENKYLFSDCSINLNPTTIELVDIAKHAIHFAKLLQFNPIKLAMLSYSTNNSGKGESVEKVYNATKLIEKLNYTNLQIAGPIQFDAAWNEKIRNKKFPELNIKNKLNTFIFPNLDASNIGYKITQRIGNYQAIGPIILGLNQPVNDISRGANINDIYYTTLITAVQTLIDY